MNRAALFLFLLPVALLLACPPELRNDGPPSVDDDDVMDDDDDTPFPDDPCCEVNGNGETWLECSDEEAAACVCDSDGWCCGEGWDETCASTYISPCGSLTCGD
jgi:hypothetical protein